MTTSYYRGHPTVWKGGRWLYADDETPTPGYGGLVRPCKHCGADMPETSHDYCLGILPGVRNACCGHGHPEKAYISFDNGLIIEGFTVVQSKEGV